MFELITRGTGNVVELVLRDEGGQWAARACEGGFDVTKVLSGWSHHYGCDADYLFLSALERTDPELVTLLRRWSVVSSGTQVHRFVSPEGVKRMMTLAPHSYRPREILDLKRQIAEETRLAEFFFASTGVIDYERVRQIVGMKLQLDGLYGAWAEGNIN